MENICGVIDLDGFYVQRKFLTREAGFASIEDPTSKKEFVTSETFFYPFDLYSRLNKKDKKTVAYVTKNILGLSFVPNWNFERPKPIGRLKKIIRDWYDLAKTDQKFVVAYKGGIHERALLEDMDIPHVNLEIFGCPKFEDLLLNPPPFMYRSCPAHRKLDDRFHCPRMETVWFRQWVLNTLKKNL